MRHWAEQYLGRPWVNGAQGPESFDCWGLVRFVSREHFGRDMPIVDVDADSLRAVVRALGAHPELAHWQQVGKPRDADCVLLGQSKKASHVGIWIAGGVLHCLKGVGVIHQTTSGLRAMGYRRIDFYRHK